MKFPNLSVFADTDNLAAGHHVKRQRRPDAAQRQGQNGVHAGNHSDHFHGRNDDAGARRGQPELGQTHAQDRLFRPDETRLGKNDMRERKTIGTINDQRNFFVCGDCQQMPDLVIR